MPVKNNPIERKEWLILAAIDEYAPVMQIGLSPREQMQAIQDTINVLQDYQAAGKHRRFVFATSIPDYCAAAAENLLKLAAMQAIKNNFALFTVGELLGTALEYIHKAKHQYNRAS